MVVGEVTFSEVVSALVTAQEALAREINPCVYPVSEFAAKLKQGHHFIKGVAAGEKVFVIGGENELERVGA
jgi:hypothetical protein